MIHAPKDFYDQLRIIWPNLPELNGIREVVVSAKIGKVPEITVRHAFYRDGKLTEDYHTRTYWPDGDTQTVMGAFAEEFRRGWEAGARATQEK